MPGIIWLIAIIVFAVLEAVTYQMISIWFVGGAIGGLVAYWCGGGFYVQMGVFLGVTAILLVATRPFVKKVINTKKTQTNADGIPGKDGIVTQAINNLENQGEVKVSGMTWSARSEQDGIIAAGEIVTVDRIEGVKLIVRRKG